MIPEYCYPTGEQQSSDDWFFAGSLGYNCLEKAGWHEKQERRGIPCMQETDLDMAELELVMGVAHSNLLSASRLIIIIMQVWMELDRK